MEEAMFPFPTSNTQMVTAIQLQSRVVNNASPRPMQKNSPHKTLIHRVLILIAAVIPLIGSAAVVTFQQGQHGYTGTLDTQVRQALPHNNLGTSPPLVANGS